MVSEVEIEQISNGIEEILNGEYELDIHQHFVRITPLFLSNYNISMFDVNEYSFYGRDIEIWLNTGSGLLKHELSFDDGFQDDNDKHEKIKEDLKSFLVFCEL